MLPAVVMIGASFFLGAGMQLPPDFDSGVNMVTADEGSKHSTRGSAGFASALFSDGSPEAMELGVKVLDAVLGCQELHEDDMHYGNFRWTLEDKGVEDLNAVEFTLAHLIPMMLMHGDRVPEPMRGRVLNSIRLGLAEINRLDVSIAYTNITSLDVLNSCLGGQLLKDEAIATRGDKKLQEWVAFTNMNGTTYEYNSPTYMGVTLDALDGLARLSSINSQRILARTFAARLGLGSALRIHPTMGRWAGPHSRAYSYTSFATDNPEIRRMQRWIKNGTLPAWTESVIGSKLPREIRETSARQFGFTLTTYMADAFSLGVASRELIDQSNCFIAHYKRAGSDESGVVISRYMLNDVRQGQEHAETEFFDAGRFHGVQDRERAIALYALPPWVRNLSSAKALVLWPFIDPNAQVWVGDRQVTEYPAQVKPGEVVVVEIGDSWMAVLPLKLTDFSHGAPIQLVKKDGALALEMYNYLGPDKLLWEMEWPGGFYKGQPQSGFYAEFADKKSYADAKSFSAAVASGQLKDEAAPALSYRATGKRPWQVEYSRDGRKLGIEVDLYEWTLDRRWTDKGDMGFPLLDCDVARQTENGKAEAGGAVLETAAESGAWLFAAPEKHLYVAGYLGAKSIPLKLTAPEGSVTVASMGVGTVVWDNGEVTVDAIDATGAEVVGGKMK